MVDGLYLLYNGRPDRRSDQYHDGPHEGEYRGSHECRRRLWDAAVWA